MHTRGGQHRPRSPIHAHQPRHHLVLRQYDPSPHGLASEPQECHHPAMPSLTTPRFPTTATTNRLPIDSRLRCLITRPNHVAVPKGAHPTMRCPLHPFETHQNDLRRTSLHPENDQVGCVSNQSSRGEWVLPPPRHHTAPLSSRRCLEGPLSWLCLALSDSVTSRFRILVNGQGRDGFALDRTPSLQPTQPHPPPHQPASSNSPSSSRCCCHRRPPRIAHRRPQPRRSSLTIAASSRPSLTTASCYHPQHHAKVVGTHPAPTSPAKVNDGLRPLAASRRRCWCRPPSSLTGFPATPQESVARVERSPLPTTNAVETGREGRFRRHHQRGRRRDGHQT